ncbi:MAG: M28 family peptidase, partial [Gemmatimonadota bacterium]|nr:M28 family peptidase [Gemmatimonadota bacterium]
MSDNDLPDIPSFEELGLSPEEVAELEKELQNEGSGDEGDASPADVSASGKGAASGSDGPAPAPKADAASAAAKGMKSGKAKKAAKPPKAKRTRKPGTAEEPGEARESPPRPSLPAPMGGLRGPISFVFLVALAWASGANRALPSPVAESAPDSVFSSARAMQHVEAIASTAHPPGSPAHDRARAYLVTELRRLGLEPSVQTTTSIVGRGTFVRAATVRNVLARMPGTASGPAVLVTAHYDGRGIAKGAGDDASGVATILETMRALRTGAPLTNDLIVLLTDGEELGLLGARAFVDEHPWMDDVGLVISIEMRGGGGPSIMFETGANSGWVVQQYKQADPYPVATSLAFEIYRRMPNDTDFTPFKEAGKQGLNFAGIGRAPVYHQVYDSPENLSPATLQHHGSHALAALRHFGMADLSAVDGPDPVYFSVPVLGLVVYPAWWVWVLAVVCVVLWLVSVAVVRARGGRWAGLFAGLLGGAGTIAGAAAAGHFLFSLRSSAHPEFGALQGSAFHSEGWYVLSLVFAGFLLGALVFGALRRWFTLGELSVGSLFIPLAGMVAATALIPLGAMILQWPFLGAVIGALAVGWFTKEGRVGSITWLILLASAVPATVMLAPVLELLWLSMSLRLGLGLGVLVALSAILVLPLLDVMRAEPNRWWF